MLSIRRFYLTHLLFTAVTCAQRPARARGALAGFAVIWALGPLAICALILGPLAWGLTGSLGLETGLRVAVLPVLALGGVLASLPAWHDLLELTRKGGPRAVQDRAEKSLGGPHHG